MDWIALEGDPLWAEFWTSEEVKSWRENLIQKLYAGKWDDETRGVIRGQLLTFDHLQNKVRVFAEAQRAAEQKELSKATDREEERISRFRLPRVS